MYTFQKSDLSPILNNIAQALDISDTLYELAVSKYKAVGAWLGADDSPLSPFSPEIYPQGSFNLGTVVRPLNEDYDLDFVFQLVMTKSQISQYDLKKLVGERLKSNETYKRMLQPEGRRYWTLQYADGAHFHMDILPAIPDSDFQSILKNRGLPITWSETSLAITDKTQPDYYSISPDWPRSNPRGFATWFRNRMIAQYNVLRKQFAESMKADIAKVPDYKIKTPLQRCVQLLKRNRDLSFVKDPGHQPISIIITTLAANAYENEGDILNALVGIVKRMPNFITRRGSDVWIQNPVDPLENFADRWSENPDYERKMTLWLAGLNQGLDEIMATEDESILSQRLEALFGETVTRATIEKYIKTDKGKTNSIYPVVTITNPDKPWGEFRERR